MTRKKIYYCNKYTKEKYFVKFVEKIINQSLTSKPLFKKICEEVYDAVYDFYDKNYDELDTLIHLCNNPLDESVREISNAVLWRGGPGHEVIDSYNISGLLHDNLIAKHIYFNDRIRHIIADYLKIQANQFYQSNGYAIRFKLLQSKHKRIELAKDFK